MAYSTTPASRSRSLDPKALELAQAVEAAATELRRVTKTRNNTREVANTSRDLACAAQDGVDDATLRAFEAEQALIDFLSGTDPTAKTVTPDNGYGRVTEAMTQAWNAGTRL